MTPFQRHRPLLHHLAWAGLLALPLMGARAQAVSEAQRAADPATPTPAVATAPARPTPVASPPLPDNPADALKQWREANERVAAFPRGHIDLIMGMDAPQTIWPLIETWMGTRLRRTAKAAA